VAAVGFRAQAQSALASSVAFSWAAAAPLTAAGPLAEADALPLAVGDSALTVTVVSEDGAASPSRTYTLLIHRASGSV